MSWLGFEHRLWYLVIADQLAPTITANLDTIFATSHLANVLKTKPNFRIDKFHNA